MCRLFLTAGLCLTIAVLASAVPLDQFCAVKKNGDYANPNDPNSYISCSNGLTYIRYCPTGLIFVENSDKCDWPTNTGAVATPSPVTTTTPFGFDAKFCSGKRDGDYTFPYNGHKFYTCSNGLTYIRDCPSNLIFNQNLDKCDWPTNTDTVVVTTPSPVTTTTPFGFDAKFCSGKRDGDYTFPYNGHKFYTCSNGLTSIRDCPSNLIFKENLNQCDWA